MDNLVKTGDLSTVHVIFKPDAGHVPQTLAVIHSYRDHFSTYEVKHATKPKHRQSKQSQNVLEGWVYAASPYLKATK